MSSYRFATLIFASATLIPCLAFAQTQLPKPDPEFKGKIGKTFKGSTPDFPEGVKAPDGAPNLVVILLDDVGFGQPETFGGPVPIPNLDKLAARGPAVRPFSHDRHCPDLIGKHSQLRRAILLTAS